MNSTPDFVKNLVDTHWTPGKKILEIGCGPAFLRDFYPKDYTGTDITDEPYNKDLPRNVDIVCAAEKLQVEDESFDIVIIKSSLYLFSSPIKALKESLRVLKNDGVIFVFDYTRLTQKRLEKYSNGVSYPCWTHWGLKKVLAKAGFSDVVSLSIKGDKLKFYEEIIQELRGSWIILKGVKNDY